MRNSYICQLFFSSLKQQADIPFGTKALILSKYYYGVISKQLEGLEVERYYSILYFLSRNDGCTQQTICNHLAIDKTAMVKVLDYLHDCKYVRREKNPVDRREHFIWLTEKGRKRTEAIADAFEALDKQLFCVLGNKTKKELLETMELLIERLKTLPSEDLFFEYNKTSGRKKTKANTITEH